MAATEPFGGPDLNPPAENCDPDVPGVSEIRTRGPNGEIIHEDDDALLGETGWHTDHAYIPKPNRGKLLYAVEVPEERGGTGFIDGFVTYDALSGETMLADNRFADMAYPLVITHPHSGKKALNCPPLWASGIVELPGEEGRALVAELIGHLTVEKFVYWHRYRPGDIAAWDNWRYLHSAEGTPGRCVRRIWSVVIRGGKVTGREIGRSESEPVGV